MPNWTNQVPTDPRGQGMPLIRTPAGRSLSAIITSDDLIGCDTHFWGGHTVPCSAPECEACQAGIAYRWHGYVSAYNPRDQLHFIFEMTAQAAQTLADYRAEHATLRCCEFEAYRWRQRKNGRVIIKCERCAAPSAALPRAPELTRIMAIIWRLPIPAVQTGPNRSRRKSLDIFPANDGSSPDPRDYATPQP